MLDNAVLASVTYAKRYLTERKLPDSAIDLLDEACSHLRLMQESQPEEIQTLNREIITLQIEQQALNKEVNDHHDNGATSTERDRLIKIERELGEKQQSMKTLMEQWEREKNKRKNEQNLKEDLDKKRKELEVFSVYLHCLYILVSFSTYLVLLYFCFFCVMVTCHGLGCPIGREI